MTVLSHAELIRRSQALFDVAPWVVAGAIYGQVDPLDSDIVDDLIVEWLQTPLPPQPPPLDLTAGPRAVVVDYDALADGDTVVYDQGQHLFVPAAPGAGGVPPDATAATKGVVKLAGDLGGTADAPTVPGLAGKADAAALDSKADQADLDAEATARASEDATLQTALDGKAALVHTHAIGDVTGLQGALDAKLDDSQLGAASGVASLDATGKVPAAQLPPAGSGAAADVVVSPAVNGNTDVQAVLEDHESRIVAGGGAPADASDTTKGVTELSVAPAVAGTPIAVGDNDPRMTAAADLATHEADTTAVHGIADTSALVVTTDARLSDQRVPTDGSVTATKVANALKPSQGAAAGVEALRALGTTASTAAAGNDARLSDARTPTGAAGGVLSGTFPNPGFAADMATQAELDTHAADETTHGLPAVSARLAFVEWNGTNWTFEGAVVAARPAFAGKIFWIGAGSANDPTALMSDGDVWFPSEA